MIIENFKNMGILDKAKKEKKEAVKKPVEKTEKKVVKKEKTAKAESAGKTSVSMKIESASPDALRVIVRPLVTEKAAHMQSDNTYAFEVRRNANKIEIAKAIKEVYGVVPRKVRVVNVLGKKVRFGRFAGSRSDYKKAMITLKKGDSIIIHEGV